VDKELIDKLLADYKSPEDIVGENGLLKQLTKAIVERALQAELSTHLGYEKHSGEGNAEGNTPVRKDFRLRFCSCYVVAAALERQRRLSEGSRPGRRLMGGESLSFPQSRHFL